MLVIHLFGNGLHFLEILWNGRVKIKVSEISETRRPEIRLDSFRIVLGTL